MKNTKWGLAPRSVCRCSTSAVLQARGINGVAKGSSSIKPPTAFQAIRKRTVSLKLAAGRIKTRHPHAWLCARFFRNPSSSMLARCTHLRIRLGLPAAATDFSTPSVHGNSRHIWKVRGPGLPNEISAKAWCSPRCLPKSRTPRDRGVGRQRYKARLRTTSENLQRPPPPARPACRPPGAGNAPAMSGQICANVREHARCRLAQISAAAFRRRTRTSSTTRMSSCSARAHFS